MVCWRPGDDGTTGVMLWLTFFQVAQTWEMLKNFYSSAKNFPTSQMSKTSNSLGSKALNLLESESDKGELSLPPERFAMRFTTHGCQERETMSQVTPQ